MNECPCKECICKPVCRHKSYFDLVTCPLLKPMFDITYNVPDDKQQHIVQKKMIEEALDSTSWAVADNGFIATGPQLTVALIKRNRK